eukprot:c22592_g1_i2 orf=375-1535(+)
MARLCKLHFTSERFDKRIFRANSARSSGQVSALEGLRNSTNPQPVIAHSCGFNYFLGGSHSLHFKCQNNCYVRQTLNYISGAKDWNHLYGLTSGMSWKENLLTIGLRYQEQTLDYNVNRQKALIAMEIGHCLNTSAHTTFSHCRDMHGALHRKVHVEASLQMGECLKRDYSTISKKLNGNAISVRKRKKIRKFSGASQPALDLVDKVLSLSNLKEEIYSELDKWAAFETAFPLVPVKQALMILKRDEKWDRICQVSKWMISKGQGKTMGTYELLLQALEKLGRVGEADNLWDSTVCKNMGSVPSKMISLMFTIYDRHNMSRQTIKLFTDVEVLGRKLDAKSVKKAAKAFGKLGCLEKEKQVLRKYNLGTIEEHDSVSSKKGTEEAD